MLAPNPERLKANLFGGNNEGDSRVCWCYIRLHLEDSQLSIEEIYLITADTLEK
jgi:hypothetical protein